MRLWSVKTVFAYAPGIWQDYDQLQRLASDAGQISNLYDFFGGGSLASHDIDGEVFTDRLRGLRRECELWNCAIFHMPNAPQTMTGNPVSSDWAAASAKTWARNPS